MDVSREIEVEHPRFSPGTLSVKPGLFGSGRLIHLGQMVPGNKRVHTVVDRNGTTTTIELRGTFDPVPAVVIDGEVVHVVPPLRWYELMWVALPLPMLVMGGAMGGLLGAAGFLTNTVLFRRGRNFVDRYVPTGVVSGFSWAALFQAGALLQSWIGVSDQQVQQMVNGVNAQVPMKLDVATTLVGAKLEGQKVTYRYLLDPSALTAEQRTAMPATVRTNQCAEPSLKTLMSSDYTVQFEYRDASGTVVEDITSRQSDCDKL